MGNTTLTMSGSRGTISSIKGYEGHYDICSDGTVISYVVSSRGKPLKPALNADGYYHVNLYKNKVPKTFYVHQLVAEAFLERGPQDREVCHNDGNKLNNDVSNLRWGTSTENKIDLVQHGGHHYAKRTHCKRGALLGGANSRPRYGRQCWACNKMNVARRRIENKENRELTVLELQKLHDEKLGEILNNVRFKPQLA